MYVHSLITMSLLFATEMGRILCEHCYVEFRQFRAYRRHRCSGRPVDGSNRDRKSSTTLLRPSTIRPPPLHQSLTTLTAATVPSSRTGRLWSCATFLFPQRAQICHLRLLNWGQQLAEEPTNYVEHRDAAFGPT